MGGWLGQRSAADGRKQRVDLLRKTQNRRKTREKGKRDICRGAFREAEDESRRRVRAYRGGS